MAQQTVSLPSKNNLKIEKSLSRGLLALTLRQVLVYGSIFLGNVLLSRWLSQSEYGIFAATLAFQSTLIFISDVGLGPALIQKHEPPSQDELASLLTVQLGLFGLVALIVWFAAPWVAVSIKIGDAGIILIRALGIIFLITGFRSIPALLLERELRFDVIAKAEVVSTVLYQVVLLCLVWFGFRVMSLVWGLAVRYTVDLIIVLMANSWRPRLSRRFSLVWPYLHFGMSMQLVRLLSYSKDYLPTLLLVPTLGATAAGYWSWSLTYIGIPIYLLQLVGRLLFPAYSRAQNDPQAIGALAETALWLSFGIGLPIVAVLVVFANYLIPSIYGSAWLQARPIVILLTPNMIGGFITGCIFPVLYATAQTKKSLMLFILWIVLTAIGSLISVMTGSLAGMAFSFSCVTLIIAGIVMRSVYHTASIQLVQSIKAPVISTLLAIVVAESFLYINMEWFVTLALMTLSYLISLFILDRKRIQAISTQLK